ncbi:MAG: hypothetical protein E2O29_02020 [Deltaproteobacteria bacterium]|nr:MAG: hypothetical protein E2O29_02020 [Deltaproteobacteria bacterium]
MAVTQIRGNVQIKAATVTETELNTSVAGNGLVGGGGAALEVNDDDSTLTIDTDVLKVKDAGITGTQLNSSVAGDGLGGGGGSALSVNVDDSTIEISADTLQVKASGITSNEIATDAVTASELDLTATYDFSPSGTIRVKTPLVDTDAANKLYVDGVAQGLDVKLSARMATDSDSNWTSSVTIDVVSATGVMTISSLSAGASLGLIDGVEPVSGNRILIKDAETASDETTDAGGTEATRGVYNGLWEVTGGTSTTLTLTRTTDADTDAEVTAGLFTFIEEGTVNKDNGFVLTANDPITLTSSKANKFLEFAQFSGAGQITAGDGLLKSGNTLSVRVDDSTIEISADILNVKDLGIDTAQLAADAVTGAKIADDQIDSEHYVADSIDAEHYAPDSVDKDAINADIAGLGLGQAAGGELDVNVDDTTIEITTDTLNVKNLGIDTAQLAADAVTSAKIGDDQIDSEHYVADSIDAEHYAPDSVDKDAINADIAGLGLGQAAGGELDVNVDDSTIEINADTLRIKASGITANELATDSVDSDEIVSGAVDVDHLSDLQVTEGTGLVADFAAGTVRNDNVVTAVSAGTTTVADDDVSFVEVDGSGTVSNNVSGFTAGRIPLAEVTAASGDITAIVDRRAWLDAESAGSGGLTESNFITREDVAFDFDGADTTGVLANTPTAGTEEVYLNGILQNEGGSDDYTISGATITFNSAPLSGDEVLVSYRKP